MYKITNYKNDATYLKYGRSDELKRRDKEHLNSFKKHNCEIEELYSVYIDPENTSIAEKKFKDFLIGMELYYEIENFSNELIKIPNGKYQDKLKIIKNQMDLLSHKYSANIAFFKYIMEENE